MKWFVTALLTATIAATAVVAAVGPDRDLALTSAGVCVGWSVCVIWMSPTGERD